MTDDILHKLKERVKELTALHKTARLLQDQSRPATEVIREVAGLMPAAWQYPEITVARIRLGCLETTTAGFQETEWRQLASFTVRGGQSGEIEVCYVDQRPPADEGPFLKEERDLIESLAEMLRFYFERLLADEALQKARVNLERLVMARTAELEKMNAALQEQISEYSKAQERIDIHQQQLRQLASELSLAEARERREIAEDLHDHIGQALAFIKMRIAQFQGNAIFCGFEETMDEIAALLNQTIQYTRNLTFEISPPALYELGLEAAIDGLAERFQKKYGFVVKTQTSRGIGRLREEVVVLLYKSVQELLTNVAKHAGAESSTIRISRDGNSVRVEVEDNGRGFDTCTLGFSGDASDRFGLFNIMERLKYLGGEMNIRSNPGKGTTVILLAPSQLDGEQCL